MSEPTSPVCGLPGCDKPAEYAIFDNHDPAACYGEVHACTDHVGQLLTTNENITRDQNWEKRPGVWTVRELETA